MKSTWQVGVVLAAALLLVVAPAAAQEEPGVSCDEAAAGEQMTCTATGLEADSEASWSATFDDEGEETDQEGTADADAEGVASFDVDVPDEPGVAYDVQVTGTDAEGGDYDESTSGEIADPEDDGDGTGDGTNDGTNDDDTNDGTNDDGTGDGVSGAGTGEVSCGEAVAGLTLTCEASGLAPDSEAQWAAFFSEVLDTAEQGSVTADAEGVATFDVALPDEPGSPYGVRVTGSGVDGGPYDQTAEGVIVAAAEDGDAEVEGAAEEDTDDDGQVSPTPKGGADTGYGGTAASSGPPGGPALLSALLLLGAAVVVAHRRGVPARLAHRVRELRAPR